MIRQTWVLIVAVFFFLLPACSAAPTVAPTPLPSATPTNTPEPTATPTNTPAPTAAPRAETICVESQKTPKIINLADRTDLAPFLPNSVVAMPQGFDNVTAQGAAIALAVNSPAPKDPVLANKDNTVACLATYNGDVSAAVLVINKQTKTVETRIYDAKSDRFIPVYDQRIVGSNLPINFEKSVASPYFLEPRRENGQPVLGLNLIAYTNQETGALIAVYDIDSSRFVSGLGLSTYAYERQFSRLQFVADLPDSFNRQVQTMYGDKAGSAISYWQYVKLNNSDSFLTPIATTVDGKQIQPIPDKTWSSIEARIDQVKKRTI
ncbi:hypothetical protein BROC_01988 [Candidatus Brocadiaceae bacterium]|nr:hypothetical protein BROC_01988 [Candidatus Brocadiaceae bacterium]